MSALAFAVFGQAAPGFWLGLMMIFFFSVDLRWFPTGGLVGKLLMRLTDIQLALPPILFAVLLRSIFGPSLRNVIIIRLLLT